MKKYRRYTVAVAHKSRVDDYKNIKEKQFKVLENDRNFWVADPFPLEKDGKLYIFVEMYEYRKLKGSIAYCYMTDDGFSPWKKIIEEPYHLSFPYIFYIDNELYMCPEAKESKVLSIYKCKEFPDVWEKESIIIDNFEFVDTVFLKQRTSEEIYGLTCDWKSINEHRLAFFKYEKNSRSVSFSNTVNSLEFYLTRPAGKVIQSGDCSILVSQICQPLYGTGLIFKDIKYNYPYYQENELFRVYSNEIHSDISKKTNGIHTYNETENFVVIDLLWSEFSIKELYYHAVRRLKKTFKQIKTRIRSIV